jgi:xylan 1,4-beta-xylosidase
VPAAAISPIRCRNRSTSRTSPPANRCRIRWPGRPWARSGRSTPRRGTSPTGCSSSTGLAGKGTGPTDASPLTVPTGDRAYEVEVTLERVAPGAQGGLLLFFNSALYLGMGWDGTSLITYGGGRRSHYREPVAPSDSLHLRIRNDRHVVTFWHSPDGVDWTRHGMRFETSGYHANTVSDLLSLRPAIFAAGQDAVTFRDFRYRALPEVDASAGAQ